MSWFSKKFEKPAKKGWVPKVGDMVVTRRQGGTNARVAEVIAIGGAYFKVRFIVDEVLAGTPAFFEIFEMRPYQDDAIQTVNA